MTETFNFDFYQIPQVGVYEPDLTTSGIAGDARTDATTTIRRTFDMKMSNFGAYEVGARLSSDYTRTNTMAFMAKGESEDVNVITEDTGVGQNVSLNKISVNHNPYIAGSTVKLTRDDQFIRMTMARNTGTSTNATNIDVPKFDVMDTNVSTAAGINLSTNAAIKNWPSEGWRSFGGKYDFLPYSGGTLK